MGTGIRMIEQHYGHVITRQQREELTKTKGHPLDKFPDIEFAKDDDDRVVVAKRRRKTKKKAR